MNAIDYTMFYAIAIEGGLGGVCVISDETALLILSLLAGENAETLFKNTDGSPLNQAQIEQVNDTLSKAMSEVSSAS